MGVQQRDTRGQSSGHRLSATSSPRCGVDDLAQPLPNPEDTKSGHATPRRRPAVDHRSLAERAPAILFRYRLLPDPEMEYVNPAVTEALGYLPEDFYADPDLVLMLLDQQTLPALVNPDPATSGLPVIRPRQTSRCGEKAGLGPGQQGVEVEAPDLGAKRNAPRRGTRLPGRSPRRW